MPTSACDLQQFCKVAIPAFGTPTRLNEFESVPSLPTGPSGQNTGHEYTGTPAVAPHSEKYLFPSCDAGTTFGRNDATFLAPDGPTTIMVLVGGAGVLTFNLNPNP